VNLKTVKQASKQASRQAGEMKEIERKRDKWKK
jgi:hypothetical protein